MGALFQNPVAAFGTGFVSHFLLDMVPHEQSDDLILEYPKYQDKNSPTVKRRTILSLIDLLIVGITIWLAWIIAGTTTNQVQVFIILFSGITGGLLPDCIVMLTFFLDNTFMKWYFDMHNKIHFVISGVSVPRTFSALYQAALSILCIYLTQLLF